MTTTEVDLNTPQVVWLGWDDYLGWLSGKLRNTLTAWGDPVTLGRPWAPGEHMALVGPTGEGKTTHAIGILELRKYVLALDAKGQDETLERAGYLRVRELPQPGWRQWRGEDQAAWRKIRQRVQDGHEARVIVGGAASSETEDAQLQVLMRDGITYCRYSGGWTLFVDEHELVSSQRMYRLGPYVERMLITARRAKTSVVTAFQAPAWVSKHATRQARRAVIWPTGSRGMIKNIAEDMGRNHHDLAAAIDQLPPFHTITAPRGPNSGPMVITRAPELSKRAASVGRS